MQERRNALTQHKHTQLRLSTRKKQHRSNLHFRIGQSGRFHLSLQSRNPNNPVLRANPYPEVTDLFCRLPLPTLFYRPEAFHLGDLLRIWVRICTKFTHLSPNSFKGQCKRIGWHKTCATFSGRTPYLRANRFQGSHFTSKPLNKKRQLSPKLVPTSLGSIVSPHKQRPKPESSNTALSVAKCGNINPLPFRTKGDTVRTLSHFRTELTYSLGSTDPCSTAVHMETFSTSVFKVLI